MGVKSKLLTSIVIAALGLSLISEGTVAYFKDTEPANNMFTTGLLDLGINKETIIQMKDIVPGDTMTGHFELTNDGSVDMKEILLHSSYEVIDNGESNNGDDLGDHINVAILYIVNGKESVVFQKRLSELKDNPQQIYKEFPAGSKAEKFMVRFQFIESGKDQNHFQTDELNLYWEFEAVQRNGKPMR
jgi:spore coat-associated protein N